jgi:hypothetical protein
VREAVVERQHQVEIGPLPVGVLAAVMIRRVAVLVSMPHRSAHSRPIVKRGGGHTSTVS